MALLPIPSKHPRTLQQEELNLQIQKQVEIDGVGMGVLTDAPPEFAALSGFLLPSFSA